MELKIKNFAKVLSANLKIDGITVIAGENNTGKSTIGKILYSVFTTFHNFDEKLRNERVRGISKNLALLYIKNHSMDCLDRFLEMCNEIVDLKTFNIDEIKRILVSEGIDIDDKILLQIKNQLAFEDNELEKLIVGNIFSKEFNNQISPMFDETSTSEVLVMIKNDFIDLKFKKNKVLSIKKMELFNDGIYIDNPLLLDEMIQLKPGNFIDTVLGLHDNLYIHEVVLKEKLNKSLIHKEALIDEAIYKKRIEKILDTIRNTISGDFIEREDRFTFSERNYDREIELANLSTGIKSFAILLKLLENKDINDNSLVVLDEPEVHLHPKWQLIYAELLILLQREFNLNIILTTHSPYFVTALDVYSRKHNIKEKCNYYLAKSENDKAVFEDVTNNHELIYKKLAEPFEILSKEEDELNNNEV